MAKSLWHAMFCLRWPIALHYAVWAMLVLHSRFLQFFVCTWLCWTFYWWHRVGHKEINAKLLFKQPGDRPPPLVAGGGEHKELWAFSASAIGPTSWFFYFIFLQTEHWYDKLISLLVYSYQRWNTQSNGTTSDALMRVMIAELTLETALVLSYVGCDNGDLVFKHGDVAFPKPDGELHWWRDVHTLIDMSSHRARTFCGNPRTDASVKEMEPAEAGFLLQYFVSHGAHVPSHVYGTWASRILPEHQDACTFWMAQCSNAMIVEARSSLPTFTMYAGHWPLVPSLNLHANGLDANYRHPTCHRQLADLALRKHSRYADFMLLLRRATQAAFRRHNVQWDAEVLLASFAHSLDHYGMWVHRIPACYERFGVSQHMFWELQTRAPTGTFVDTRLCTANLPYLQDIYRDVKQVNHYLADALHFAISW